jgi:hypothetical protein
VNVTEPFHSMRRPVDVFNHQSGTVADNAPSLFCILRSLGWPQVLETRIKTRHHTLHCSGSEHALAAASTVRQGQGAPAPSSCNFFHSGSSSGSKGVRQIRLLSWASFAALARISSSWIFLPSTCSNSRIRSISLRASPANTRSSLRTAPLLVRGLLLVSPQSCVCF